MKKLALTIVCLLFVGVAFSNHWTPVNPGNNMTLNCYIAIDGQAHTGTNLEMGAFVGDECRESKYPVFFPLFSVYMYTLTIQGDENGEVISFRLYDSEKDEELILNCDYTLGFVTDGTNIYMGLDNPLLINFTTPAPQPTTFPLDIIGYGEQSNPGGYYLISSPIGDVATGDVEGLTTGSFDLYSFDQTADMEWINMHNGGTLEAGKGYLYANSVNTTLTFSGTAYTGTGTFDLVYSTTNPDATMHGWNLVGNPYATAASVDRNFYVMITDGSEIIAGSGNVAAMNGIFVKATAAGESVTFTQGGTDSGSKLALNLVHNDRSATLVDRAVVRFDEGGTLPKFMLDPTNTRVYIPQDGTDYAVVSRGADNSMPVSFKAKENGSYTLKVETTNLDLGYLHLIDNKTGNDVDLLATPSYTFDAATTDAASRFSLVFLEATNVDENFAFFNGEGWNVNNEGQGILQVLDMTGRMVSTTTLNGNAEVNINEAAGVYMLRLVNGNDVKVQKVVIK